MAQEWGEGRGFQKGRKGLRATHDAGNLVRVAAPRRVGRCLAGAVILVALAPGAFIVGAVPALLLAAQSQTVSAAGTLQVLTPRRLQGARRQQQGGGHQLQSPHTALGLSAPKGPAQEVEQPG